MMNIRPALANDIDTLMDLYAQGRSALAALGIDQWQGGYPDRATVEADVARGETFVIEDDGAIGGVAMIGAGGDADYDRIDGAWLTDCDSSNPTYLVVHRIATSTARTRRGYASRLISYAEQRARDLGCASVRIDTHPGNVRMRGLMGKLGFKECGIIMISHSSEGTPERIAFEKLV